MNEIKKTTKSWVVILDIKEKEKLAKDPKTSPEILKKLAEDEYWEVRWRVNLITKQYI